MARDTDLAKMEEGTAESSVSSNNGHEKKEHQTFSQTADSVDDRASQVVSDGPQSFEKAITVAANSPTQTSSSFPVGFIRQHELVDRVRAYDPNVNEDLLNKAYVFSMKAHGAQKRKSGDPYFTHPLAVAGILTELKADPATVATALLHDVVEDTETSVTDIRRIFGTEIAVLVDGVTKLSAIELRGEASKKAENFRKLVMAMADDVRVLLVKLADRLHNMRTLEHHEDIDKRRQIAIETLEIFAPLAGRVGVQRFREELEDLSFREISPQAYETISERLKGLQENIVTSVVELSQVLRRSLDGEIANTEVFAREKRPYSIWRKMSVKNASFDELADIYAFRVLVDTVPECYKVLGIIHSNWRMIPSEFDDYISAPKPNGYKSIHTAVIGPPNADGERQRVEVQIRTRAMHESAERGIAAHWQYKDRGASSTATVEINTAGGYDPYETPRRLVEMFAHGEDPEEALKYAKLELFQDQVFCFTPKGRIIPLPKGATSLDFAYAVHTDIGDACIGAKINGVAKPMRTPLKNGDVIAVIRSENAPPPLGWETLAFTGRARSAIRRRIRKMEHDEQLILGRTKAEAIFQDDLLDLTPKAITAALTRLGEKSVDDVFAKVGRGDLAVSALVEAIYPGASFEPETEIKTTGLEAFKPRLVIDGLPARAAIRVGRCCSPLPGERIIGIRGEGTQVMVHAIHCAAVAEADPPQAKWVDLRWQDQIEGIVIAFARVVVTLRNEVGVLSDVAGVIARYGISIANIAMKNHSPEFVDCHVDVMVGDVQQVEQMLAGLRAQSNVLTAERYEGTTYE